jgi:predicted component of type VI protein secretion system
MSRTTKLLATAALVGVLAAGCATGQKTASADPDPAAPSTTAPAPETSDPGFPEEGVPEETPAEPIALQVGGVATLSSNDTNEDVLRVTVTKVETIGGEEYNTPKRGRFLGVYVKVKALADDQSSLWGDFYVSQRGHHYDPDAYTDRWQPTLDYVDLNEGEVSEGWLVFDVPSRHGEVVLNQSYEGGKLATWSF